MEFNNDPKWLKKLANQEDNGCISVGGLLSTITKSPQASLEQMRKYNFTYLGFGYQKSSRGRENPFVIVFVYTDLGYNYLLSGMNNKIEEFLKYLGERYRMVYNKTYWDKGCRCSSWSSNCSIYIWDKKNLTGHKKYQIDIYGVNRGAPEKTLYVRRVPRRWLSDYSISDRSKF